MLDAELVEDVAALEPVADAWDALAVGARTPLAAPAWVLAWWRHLASPGTEPRVVLVRDGSELVGVAPYFVQRGTLGRRDYRLAGSGLYQRIAPVAAPSREWDVAEAIAGALASARPRPDLVTLEGSALADPWRTLLRERWPGPLRARRYDTSVLSAPIVTLDAPSFDDWLAAKSANFRSQMRRLRRQLERDGGARLATAETLRDDLEAFARLHSDRWEGRGASNLDRFGTPLVDALAEAGAQQLDDGRFRLWMLESEGEPIAAQVFMAAGGEVSYWNGGWDERFARLKPPQLAILCAIEDAFARGDSRVDLGGGAQPYKLRFADGNDPLSWGGVIAPGPRAPLARLTLAPMHAKVALRTTLTRTLTPEQRERLKQWRDRRSAR